MLFFCLNAAVQLVIVFMHKAMAFMDFFRTYQTSCHDNTTFCERVIASLLCVIFDIYRSPACVYGGHITGVWYTCADVEFIFVFQVLHFPVLQFPVLHFQSCIFRSSIFHPCIFGLPFSGPAFSTLHFWSCNFLSCIFRSCIFSPAFSSTAFFVPQT